MSAAVVGRGKRYCPGCGDPYRHRAPSRTAAGFSLGRLYRCVHAGHVYLHPIPTEQAATVPYGGSP